jgi:hypothetical protein
MIMLIYATSAEMATYTGVAAPSNSDALLRYASLLVRRATSQAIYTVDEDGFPTETSKLDAFRDATCAQAHAWAINNIDPSAGAAGVSGVVAKKSLGSASVDYAVSGTASNELSRLANGGLSQEAYLILQLEQLITPGVITDYPIGSVSWLLPS